ncbi:MAG TPA: SDR family oxidoreductase, partial [Rhodothermales bacterium]
MDLGLKGKVAFVAGASSGLGLASARELAAEGCHVVLCSRDAGRIAAAAESVRSVGTDVRVLPLTCDVTSEEQIVGALSETVSTLGGLNILVTNAGGPPSGLVGDFDADDWRSALELNLMSTINLTRHALPHLRDAARTSGHARIIMITSVSAKQPIPNLYLSNVARAGVHGFAKSLAEEVGREGITVNTLLPGFTRTERLVGLARSIQERTGRTPEDTERDWASAAALQRIAEPEEFAAALAFLASKRASYITGVSLPVDGGR